MHRTRIALALAALAAIPAVADEPCFCLQDPDPASDRLWYDCVQYNQGLSPDPLFACFPSTDADARTRVERGHTLSRIDGGNPPCKPCRVADSPPRNACRGADGQPGGTPQSCP